MFGIFGNKDNRDFDAPGDLLMADFVGGRNDGAIEDLPCPWCHAQTSDQDAACPSCGRNFGGTDLRS